jgi:7,8-dihydropterin-6-yl-methyl-4-(beta-D-ribofuranosyl)aminobenzene 5'-phosphate synthase
MCETTTLSHDLPTQNRPSGTTEPREKIHLRGVDSVDVTVMVDNTIDLLLTSDKQVKRESFSPGWTGRPKLLAEHGYAVLIKIQKKGKAKSVLYDAGLTPETILHNLDALQVHLSDIEAIVLSHGHTDHNGGLLGIIRKIGKQRLPIILHPDAWRNRKLITPTGGEIELPPPDRRTLEKEDVHIVEERGPSFLLGEEALITGQVERVTDFEKGMRNQYAQENGGWVADPWVWDDQGIICNVNGKGLVVISSCSHSGVINVLRNAQKITGVSKVHAFVGGLHLPSSFHQIIPETIRELETIRPDLIVPGHCSGWKAINEIVRTMPEAYVPSSVGTEIHFS